MKRFLKCIPLILTISLLLASFPLTVGADGTGSASTEPFCGTSADANAVIGGGITITPQTPVLDNGMSLMAITTDQTANRSPSSYYYTHEDVMEEPYYNGDILSEYLDSADTIVDGVYSIESLAYELWGMFNAFYLDEPETGFVIQLADYQGMLPSDCFEDYGMFKISKKPGTDYYVIRWMNNPHYGITGTSGSLALKVMPAKDAQVLLTDTFSITYDGGGFVIKPYGKTTAITAPSDAYDGQELTLENPSNAGTRARWSLARYIGPAYHGFRMGPGDTDLIDGLDFGEAVEIKVFGYSTYPNVNHISASKETDGASTVFEWDAFNQEIIIAALHGTQETFCISLNDWDGTAVLRFIRDVNVEAPPVADGVYFIENRGTTTPYYMAVENTTANSKVYGSLLEGFNGYRWWVELVGCGEYKITSYHSNMVLTVPANDIGTSGVDLVQSPDTGHAGQRFAIGESSSGGYILRPKSAEQSATDWCVSRSAISPRAYVEQTAYTNDSSHSDEWSFVPCDDYSHTYVGDYVGDPQMPPLLQDVEEAFFSTGRFGYGNLSVQEDEFFRQLETTKIVTLIAHGDKYGIELNSAASQNSLEMSGIPLYAPEVDISSSDILSLDLSGVQLVCLGSCSTGKDGIEGREAEILAGNYENFADTFYLSGASVVVSYKCKIYFEETIFWMKSFMLFIKSGNTVEQALSLADMALNAYYHQEHNGAAPPAICPANRYVVGNQDIIPCPN